MTSEPVDYLDPLAFDPETPASSDFYRHVNGGWLVANPVPADFPMWGGMTEIQVRNEDILHEVLVEAAEDPGPGGSPSRMVGDYFAAGMDEAAIASAGTDPLGPLLDRISAIESLDDLRRELVALRRAGVSAFHGLGINPDFEDADRYLVYVGQGGLGLPERDYYLREDERSKALAEAYVDHVAAQLEHLGTGGRTEAEAIFALEKRLAEASLPAAELRDLRRTLNRHEVDALDELMPRFGLGGYVRDLGVTSETVNVDHPAFFEVLDEVLGDTPIETIRSYLAWHLVRTFAEALSPEFEDEAFDFYHRKIGGQQEPRERWTRILAAASADIGEQVARLYVERAFPPAAKERCEALVDGLVAAMGRSIRGLDWMTDPTKEEAQIKVNSFTYKIGYPDEWRDYSALTIDRSSFVENRMRSAVFEYDRQMGRLEEPVDTTEWAMPAHIVNAYYNPLLNEIVFPAGILQPPMFYADADDALNFGGIGTVIGHEITHGFDDNGSQFDEVGRRRNWWTEEDRTEFEQRADALADQFSAYQVADDQKVNGRLTLGENIADLGGLAIAYDAFLQTLDGDEPEMGGYSPQARFFLAYGTIWRMNYTDEFLRMMVNVDVHSPNQFRVNGPLSNFAPFAEVFDVGEDSPMRRPAGEIVKIW